MEARGKVNEYSNRYHVVHTLNLAVGVTPFIMMWAGETLHSTMYRLSERRIVISRVWYRPGKEEFSELGEDVQDYVLNGGLLHAPLGKQTLANDPTTTLTTYNEFQQWCLKFYGKSRVPKF